MIWFKKIEAAQFVSNKDYGATGQTTEGVSNGPLSAERHSDLPWGVFRFAAVKLIRRNSPYKPKYPGFGNGKAGKEIIKLLAGAGLVK